MKRYRWTWPSLSDPQRRRALRFGASYQPAFFLVDAQGRYVAGFQGAGSPALWSRLLRQLRR